MAQIRVADKRARVAESSIDVSGNRQLVVTEQIAEHKRGTAGEGAVVRSVPDRGVSDVVRVEGDMVRVLLEASGVGQTEQRV